MLDNALDAGLLGMSGMDAAIDKLDGERFRSRALPSTFATWRERRKLIGALRRRAPDPAERARRQEPARPRCLFFLASGRLFGRRAGCADEPAGVGGREVGTGRAPLFGPGTRLLNRVLGASVRFQHLPVPFELYSDGIDLPVFEEFGAGTAALHLREQLERNELLADPDYRRRFRTEFDRRILGPTLWHRDFHDAKIVACPDASLVGKSFGDIADERDCHPLDAFLDVLVENGERNVRWTTTVANHRPQELDRLAAEPSVHMGFSDAGAHLRNMAFYNYALRLLKRTLDADRAGRPFLSVQRAVYRLTAEVADWFGVPRRHPARRRPCRLRGDRPGRPRRLRRRLPRGEVDFYGGLSRMVNRNDAAVVATGVNGVVVFRDGEFCDGYGTTVRAGRFLRAGAEPPPA